MRRGRHTHVRRRQISTDVDIVSGTEIGEDRRVIDSEYFVEIAGGEQIERDTIGAAMALATLVDQLGGVAMYEQHKDVVPTKVAIEGMPAIATYLRGVHQMPREKIAEELEVTQETVTKYLTRFRPFSTSTTL